MQHDPDDKIEALKRRLHGEILRVIGEHQLEYDELYRLTGHYFDRHHMWRLREFIVSWSPKKYIRIAKALGIGVRCEVFPVASPQLQAILATRRARRDAAAA